MDDATPLADGVFGLLIYLFFLTKKKTHTALTALLVLIHCSLWKKIKHVKKKQNKKPFGPAPCDHHVTGSCALSSSLRVAARHALLAQGLLMSADKHHVSSKETILPQ